MSRADKQLRRKRRKEKRQHHDRMGLPVSGLPSRLADVDLPSGSQLLTYEITPEALNRPDELTPGLDDVLDPIRDQLFEQTKDDPGAAIPVLQQLLERFPNAPLLMNWLSAALSRTGAFKAAERVARDNFQANPDYLFARINYVQLRLADGDLKVVEEIFDNKFDLKLLYPDRDVFHVSEFRAFSQLMITYRMRKGEFKTARLIFDALEQLEPDGEVTESLRPAVKGSYLVEAAQRLTKVALGSGRLPRW